MVYRSRGPGNDTPTSDRRYHCLLIRICCELPSAEPIEAEFCTVVRRRYDTIRYDAVYLTCSKKLTGSQLIVYHTFPVIFVY